VLGSGTVEMLALNVPAPCAVNGPVVPPVMPKPGGTVMPEKLSEMAASTKLSPGTVKVTES